MLRHILFFITVFIALSVRADDAFVDKLLAQMSDEDKCGQMNQITLDVITKCPDGCSSTSSDGTPSACSCPPVTDVVNPVDLVKLRQAIQKYRVGSILNTAYNRAQPSKIWHEIIQSIQDEAFNTTLKIPVLFGLDSIHGANYVQEATLMPQPLAMASSFNTDISRRVGQITAMETRAIGVPWNFNPVLDIGRQHLWPRVYETYGEDVHLAIEMGKAYIEGSQGQSLKNRTTVATCLKHYIGYSYPLNGKDRTEAWIPEIILREYFLPPFAAGVAAGSPTVMINSGDVNGIPGHSNSFYINDILKGELDFKGFTVSDWEDIIRLHTRDKVAATPEEAVRMAVMAGLDMSMVPFGYDFFNNCMSLVKKDKEFLSRVNDANRRILKVKDSLGLFDQNGSLPVADDLKNINRDDSRQFNLEAARESIVLAKNDESKLPLNKGSKILVVGTTCGNLRVLNGGWSYEWQGRNEEYYTRFATGSLTILQAIRNKTSIEPIYLEGANFTNTIDLDDIADKAKDVDEIILCIGEDTYTEAVGNIDNLFLDEAQQQLADTVLNLKKSTVLVYLGGRPRIITKIAKSNYVKSVLISFLPGNRGSEALADIIFGDYNPDAKLPITYPGNPNGQTSYDVRPLELTDPNKYEYLYPFGHGLSYTTYEYSDLKLSETQVDYAKGVKVSLRVKNTGAREGKETVILYLEDCYASVSRPIKQVKGFQKISLKPNEEKTVEFTLQSYDFTFIGRNNKRIAEDGDFYVYVGGLKSSFALKNSPQPPTTTSTTASNTIATSTLKNHATYSKITNTMQILITCLFVLFIKKFF